MSINVKTDIKAAESVYPRLMFSKTTDYIYFVVSSTELVRLNDKIVQGNKAALIADLVIYHGSITLSQD